MMSVDDSGKKKPVEKVDNGSRRTRDDIDVRYDLHNDVISVSNTKTSSVNKEVPGHHDTVMEFKNMYQIYHTGGLRYST